MYTVWFGFIFLQGPYMATMPLISYVQNIFLQPDQNYKQQKVDRKHKLLPQGTIMLKYTKIQ